MLNIEKYKKEIVEEYNTTDDEDCLEVAITNIMCDLGGIKSHLGWYTIEELMDWLTSEYKEPTLTHEEKEYLGNVIKPFKDRVIYICKASIGDSIYQIEIYYKEEDGDKDVIALPAFNAGTMYKGMQIDSYYDLEELGLWKDF